MRLGIMQPYFFPYLGHFSLISLVDEWIVFDVTQYTPKSWMNRNRILHPTTSWQYITIPLSNSSQSIKTSEAKVLNLQDTKKSIEGKLGHYKKKAPYFNAVIDIVRNTFDSTLSDTLVELDANGLRLVCQYLNIPFRYRICSELNIPFPDNLGPGDWAPYVCEHLKATEYINPVSGSDLFDSTVFERQGTKLLFASCNSYSYKTGSYQFEPNLSILDVLMWNSPEEVSSAIKMNVSVS